MQDRVLALDQGTTSSRAILFDRDGRPVASAAQEFTQYYPHPGWVEHDPDEIWLSQLASIRGALEKGKTTPDRLAAIGITNQRETTLLWDRRSGTPIYRAIVWQCRRTAAMCDELGERKGFADYVRQSTGLVIDAYFSATKLKWILDNVAGARARAEAGELLFGTIDTWLLWKLTAGKCHATDVSNASRTMLFNIVKLDWDTRILEELDIPRSVLPEVRESSFIYGSADPALFEGHPVPIGGVAGDQQAALFGQTCFKRGEIKNTYGTGCFLMMNTASNPVPSSHGLLTTVAWKRSGGVKYALEGSVFIAGAAIQWLRDEMGLIRDARESGLLAASVPDSLGVYFVPAFVGLGAPVWDMYARGTIVGLTRGSGRAHVVRSALEAIAYQTRDVLGAIEADSGVGTDGLRVDGGASANDFLMQFQADILGVPVTRPRVRETTALGAAYLAGLAVGFWRDETDLESRWQADRVFEPAMSVDRRDGLYGGWLRAVERSRRWVERDSD